jgi:hypothetical protein
MLFVGCGIYRVVRGTQRSDDIWLLQRLGDEVGLDTDGGEGVVIPWVHNRLLSWSDAKDRVEAADPLFYSHRTVEGRLYAGEIGSGQASGSVVPIRELSRENKATDDAVCAMPRLQRVAIECRYRGPREEADQVRAFMERMRKGKTAYYSAIDTAHWFIFGMLT